MLSRSPRREGELSAPMSRVITREDVLDRQDEDGDVGLRRVVTREDVFGDREMGDGVDGSGAVGDGEEEEEEEVLGDEVLARICSQHKRVGGNTSHDC